MFQMFRHHVWHLSYPFLLNFTYLIVRASAARLEMERLTAIVDQRVEDRVEHLLKPIQQSNTVQISVPSHVLKGATCPSWQSWPGDWCCLGAKWLTRGATWPEGLTVLARPWRVFVRLHAEICNFCTLPWCASAVIVQSLQCHLVAPFQWSGASRCDFELVLCA